MSVLPREDPVLSRGTGVPGAGCLPHLCPGVRSRLPYRSEPTPAARRGSKGRAPSRSWRAQDRCTWRAACGIARREVQRATQLAARRCSLERRAALELALPLDCPADASCASLRPHLCPVSALAFPIAPSPPSHPRRDAAGTVARLSVRGAARCVARTWRAACDTALREVQRATQLAARRCAVERRAAIELVPLFEQ